MHLGPGIFLGKPVIHHQVVDFCILFNSADRLKCLNQNPTGRVTLTGTGLASCINDEAWTVSGRETNSCRIVLGCRLLEGKTKH